MVQRRSCARFCRDFEEVEQIQSLLGHASVQSTERYLGFKQKLLEAVNDRFQIALPGGESLTP
jgi:integrase